MEVGSSCRPWRVSSPSQVVPSPRARADPESGSLHEDRSGALCVGRRRREVHTRVAENKQSTVVVQLGGAPVAVRDANAKKQGAKLTGAQKDAIRAPAALAAGAFTASSRTRAPGSRPDAGRVQRHPGQRRAEEPRAARDVFRRRRDPRGGEVQADERQRRAARRRAGGLGSTPASTGAGIKVAVIDTGIDYTHADFGGPGTAAAYKRARTARARCRRTRLFGPAAPKVKGGNDFVGDDYDADPDDSELHRPAARPEPARLQRPRLAHGRHGGRLRRHCDGATYTGRTTRHTVPCNAGTSVPGVAPKADLYAFRVFGCAGRADIVDLAINQAVADDMDVINMSLGSTSAVTTIRRRSRRQNAVDDGVIVVASAGNAGGERATSVGSPSTANGVLSVAAMDGTTADVPGRHFALSTGRDADAINANGATFSRRDHRCRSSSCYDSMPAGEVVARLQRCRRPGGQRHRQARRRPAWHVRARREGDLRPVRRAQPRVAMINNSRAIRRSRVTITSNPDTGEPHAKSRFRSSGSPARSPVPTART